MKCAIKTTALLVALSTSNLVFAQVANSTSNSSATSSATSNANGQAITVNVSSPNVSVSSPSSTAGTAANPEVSESNVNVNNTGTSSVRTNPNIQAPSLTTTLTDTCMGSYSLGVSLTGFGASGGSTMVDQACVRRLDSREFRAMGLNDVALALLCQSDANRKAVEATGRSCPGTPPKPVAAAAAPQVQAKTEDTHAVKTVVATPDVSAPTTEAASGLDMNDPAIRYRLGLAPQQ